MTTLSSSKAMARRILLFFICVTSLTVASLVLNAASEPPAVGTMAPDFTLISESGTPVSLHDFRGKWVVLYFYPKDFTHGCTIEAHSFQRDLAQYDQKNAVIVGVSVDTTGSHKEFCAKEGLHFKLLADTQHKVSAMYDSQMQHGGATVAARNTFLINPQGKVVKVFMHVDPTVHSQQVLAALNELEGSAASR